MLPGRRTFESEKQQLQLLNSRLAQYLSRTKQLEQENAHLLSEVSQLRRARTPAWEPGYKVELRELRRTVERMAVEKSEAEMEREKLWRELQMVQSLCSEQTEVCRDIGGELRGCEKELRHAHLTNSELEKRLQQLQSEYRRLEEAHRQEMERLHRQVESRVVPIVTQTYRGPPAASVEEVQDYARGLSEGWIETFDMYQNQVEAMEEAIKADQVKLRDLQREKSQYVAELDHLRTDAERQGQIQGRLEKQLMHMEEKFHADCSQYQMIIEQLEHQRNMMAQEIERKMMEHQQLLQVKMDLGMEVAGYRSLLEGERAGMQEAHRRGNHHQRERIIDIKLPSQPYTPRASTTVRQHRDVSFTPRPSYLARSSLPSGSRSPSRVIPITVTGRSQHQSPASRRDMVSFNKARAASSVPVQTITKEKTTVQSSKPASQSVHSVSSEEKRVEIKQVSQVRSQPVMMSSAETKSEQMESPTLKTKSQRTEEPVKRVEENVRESDVREKERAEVLLGPSEKAVLDNVSVEEIIEKVMKPAGLDAKACSSGESKVTYHVEKSEMEDGTTKTQIVLQSKVEEEVDISEDAALDELLNQGVKKMSLEDIKDTATASMIKNLLSGLQGDENLEHKSVNVEIIEEPVESYSDEEEVAEQGSKRFEPSTYFQIEELGNVQHAEKSDQRLSFTTDATVGSTQEAPKELDYLSPELEASEYFVSTPDENLSELEEGGGITSYGHYGLVDDLSDERYYQDERLPPSRVIVEESQEYKFVPDDLHFTKESIPECIIEEEVRVSPIVQESVLEFLREDSLEPQEQLKGALEKLQESVSGPLKEELAFLTKVSSESPQNVAIKKVQQTSGNGTMTIVAELNVSQSLEDSGLLQEEDLSEEQIMAALKSSHLEKAFQSGAGGYSFTISKEEDDEDEFEGFGDEAGSACVTTERIIKIGPSEESFTFQLEGMSSDDGQQAHILPTKISHEKKIATVYLESSPDN
ncbi:synemin [Neosynchiropus ocellatus]